MVENCAFYSAFCTLVLLVWFHSGAAEEYISLFKLDTWFDLPTFEEKRLADPELTYPDFLVIYHNNYFTRLLSCPLCITVWFHTISYLHHFDFRVSVISALSTTLLYSVAKKGQEEE